MKTLIILALLLFGIKAENHVKWKVSLPEKLKVGDEVDLKFEVKIDPKWYVYSSDLQVDGPMPTKLKLDDSEAFTLIGKLLPCGPKEKQDDIWGGKINYFEKSGKLIQKIKINSAGTITGTLSGQACSNIDGMCMPFNVPFSVDIKI
jgi:Disulphide bond corrector protein DsbC